MPCLVCVRACMPVCVFFFSSLCSCREPVVIYTGGSASDVAAHTVTVRRGGDDVKAVNFPSLVVGLVCLTHSPHASGT